MDIKMIALDLDGTTLSGDKSLSEENSSAIKRAIERGIKVAFATGRVFDTLPEQVTDIEGIYSYICSNGASVIDPLTLDNIYKRTLDPEAVVYACDMMRNTGFMFESFADGHAYIGRDFYYDIKKNGCAYRSADYVLSTRIPVDDIFSFTVEHKDAIENMNVFFPSDEEKASFRNALEKIKDTELTSSFRSNYELGPKGVSKGNALEVLMEREHIRREELFAMGDSPNDLSMIRLAGVSASPETSDPVVIKETDFITPEPGCDAVSYALRRLGV